MYRYMIVGWTSTPPKWDTPVGCRPPPQMGHPLKIQTWLGFALVLLAFPLVLLCFPLLCAPPPPPPVERTRGRRRAAAPPVERTRGRRSAAAPPVDRTRGRRPAPAKPKENQAKTKENQRKSKQNQEKSKQNQEIKKIRGVPFGGGAWNLRTSGGVSHLGGGGLQPTTSHHIYPAVWVLRLRWG